MAGGRRKGELLLWGERRGQNRSALPRPREDLALPFYQTRGQATLVKREKKIKRWYMHNSRKEEIFSHAVGPTVLGSCWLLLPCAFACVRPWCHASSCMRLGHWILLIPDACMASEVPKTTREGHQLVGSHMVGEYMMSWTWFMVIFL
jgi:hypothetical protein